MSLIQTEASIIQRLSVLRDAGLMVRTLPDRSNETGEIQGTGVLTLSWALDELSAPDSMGGMRQTCLINWAIDGRIKTMRDDKGMLAIRDALYSLLIGFRPTGAQKMYAKSFEFVERLESWWRFESIFVSPAVLFEVPDAGEEGAIAATLREIFLRETINNTTLTPDYPLIEED